MPSSPDSPPSLGGEKEIEVRDVGVGHYLHWCGYRVRVNDVLRGAQGATRQPRKPSVLLTVADPLGGEDRVLHYWADELVTVDA